MARQLIAPACGGGECAAAQWWPTPLSTLDPAGPAGAAIARLWWVMLAAALLIFVATVALALYAACRNPARRVRIAPRALIVGGGLVLPLTALAALLAYGIGAGQSLLPLSGTPGVYRVEVRAHQWWWEVRYPQASGGPLYSANEVHVPAGRPIDVHVSAEDVIHGFWVPRLGGKIDAIPGRTSVIRLRADRAGVYHGVCAEFCGAQHARMALQWHAHEPAAFEAYMARLGGSGLHGAGVASVPPDALAASLPPFAPLAPSGATAATAVAAHSAPAGRQTFERLCVDCHSLDARQRGSGRGPNLAGLADRATLGAGTLRNDAAGLRRWLAEHATLKPGNRMVGVPRLDADALDALATMLGEAQ